MTGHGPFARDASDVDGAAQIGLKDPGVEVIVPLHPRTGSRDGDAGAGAVGAGITGGKPVAGGQMHPASAIGGRGAVDGGHAVDVAGGGLGDARIFLQGCRFRLFGVVA